VHLPLGASASDYMPTLQQTENPIWSLIYCISNTYSKAGAKKALAQFFIKFTELVWLNHSKSAPSCCLPSDNEER
jgi:hypothetical protein